ncbi:transcription activator BRG1-like [Zophobas morio]|uniref:transcription activator BRG1-like n=1 Tax=Zophobas morio TaxID=2755281 RepID=UPI003083BA72
MKNKILEGKYKSVKDFEQDMLLMADNAKLYNGADSFVYRDALKLLGVFYKTLELLKPYEAKLYKRVHEEIREASGVEEKNKRKKVKTSAVELLENL